MSSPSYLRIGGLALLIGCLIAVVFQILTFVVPGPLGVQGPPAAWVAWLGVLGGVVTLVGLPALYTAQPKRLAALGLLGMIGLFLALLLFEVVLDIIAATVFAHEVRNEKLKSLFWLDERRR